MHNNSNSVDFSNDIDFSVDERKMYNIKAYNKRKPDSSPKARDNSFMKYDERGTPAVKKKDLNIFLNDRQKYKNLKNK